MPQPTQAAIALGTNLGDRPQNLQTALQHLAQLGTVEAVSTFHDTAPELYLPQPRFLNAAALLTTALPPLELLHALLAIEQTMGRTRTGVPAKGPRLIDLDLLLYGDEILITEALTLPHPALAERRFVLAPLAEIAPTLLHPALHRTIQELLFQAMQPTSDIDKPALKQAALDLQAAIAAFDPGSSGEAQTVRGFVNRKALIDDAIHERIDQPLASVPNAMKALDGALQGYPALEAPYYAFMEQLQGIRHMRRMQETIRKWQESKAAF